MNIDEEHELQQRYGVQSIPTMILFKDGVPVHRVLGLMPKAALRAQLEPWIPAR